MRKFCSYTETNQIDHGMMCTIHPSQCQDEIPMTSILTMKLMTIDKHSVLMKIWPTKPEITCHNIISHIPLSVMSYYQLTSPTKDTVHRYQIAIISVFHLIDLALKRTSLQIYIVLVSETFCDWASLQEHTPTHQRADTTHLINPITARARIT